MTSSVDMPQKRKRKVPDYLIYETLNGKPLYYKGYKDVIRKKKKPEEIMGSSSLQAAIVSLIHVYLSVHLSDDYLVVTNEAGLHIDVGDNLANDIAVYWQDDIGTLNDNYFSTSPHVVIEVDIKADMADYATDEEYIIEKTQKMLDFGTQKIVWVLTKNQKIVVAEKLNPTWLITNWQQDIVIDENCILNLNELVKKKRLTAFLSK